MFGIIAESVFTFIPEPCSESSRNAVRHHRGIAFILPRIPHYGPYFKIVCEIPVAIDIKPSGCSNTINPKSEGIVRVAILSSSTFDARAVDQNSLTFGERVTNRASHFAILSYKT